VLLRSRPNEATNWANADQMNGGPLQTLTQSRGVGKAFDARSAAFGNRAQTAADPSQQILSLSRSASRVSRSESRSRRASVSREPPKQALPPAVAAYLGTRATPFIRRAANASKKASFAHETALMEAPTSSSPPCEPEYPQMPPRIQPQPERHAALMIHGGLSESDKLVSGFSQRLPGDPCVSSIQSISCDDCRVFVTSSTGQINQWLLHNGQLIHCPQYQLHASQLSSHKVLAEDESIQSVHPCGAKLYLQTNEGRILKVGTASYECSEEDGCVWQAVVSDATPLDKAQQPAAVALVGSTPLARHGWVVLRRDSTVAVLDDNGSKQSAPQSKASLVTVRPKGTMLVSRRGEVYSISNGPARMPINHSAPQLVKMGDLKVTQVACGLKSTTLLTSEGAVFVYGAGSYTGLGIVSEIKEPSLLSCLWGQCVRTIACGTEHAVALTESGSLFSWGKAQGPQGSDQLTPKLLNTHDSPVSMVVCGPRCTIALQHFEKEALPTREDSTPCSFVKMMSPPTLIDSIQVIAENRAAALSPVADITRVSSYSKLVKKNKQDHHARRQTGGYGILPPLAQQMEDQKNLVDLSSKCMGKRWDTMSAKSGLEPRLSRSSRNSQRRAPRHNHILSSD